MVASWTAARLFSLAEPAWVGRWHGVGCQSGSWHPGGGMPLPHPPHPIMLHYTHPGCLLWAVWMTAGGVQGCFIVVQLSSTCSCPTDRHPILITPLTLRASGTGRGPPLSTSSPVPSFEILHHAAHTDLTTHARTFTCVQRHRHLS